VKASARFPSWLSRQAKDLLLRLHREVSSAGFAEAQVVVGGERGVDGLVRLRGAVGRLGMLR
jgi:hypothetical protein